jgi:hypothetical protein
MMMENPNAGERQEIYQQHTAASQVQMTAFVP